MGRTKILRKGFCNRCHTQDIPSLMHAYCPNCSLLLKRERERIRQAELLRDAKCIRCAVQLDRKKRYCNKCRTAVRAERRALALLSHEKSRMVPRKGRDYSQCDKCDGVIYHTIGYWRKWCKCGHTFAEWSF